MGGDWCWRVLGANWGEGSDALEGRRAWLTVFWLEGRILKEGEGGGIWFDEGRRELVTERGEAGTELRSGIVMARRGEPFSSQDLYESMASGRRGLVKRGRIGVNAQEAVLE